MKIQTHLIENTWLDHPHGWGNGYVGVPKGHPWYGLDTVFLEGVSTHRGITYAECRLPDAAEEPGLWWVGFDTNHSGDDIESCPKEYVEEVVENLRMQAQRIADLENGTFSL